MTFEDSTYPRRVLSFDPGPVLSAFTELEIPTPEQTLPTIIAAGHYPNMDILAMLDERLETLGRGNPSLTVVVEKVVNYGNIVGRDIFSTVLMAGFLCDTARHNDVAAYLIANRDWVRTITGRNQTGGSEIYQRMRDMYAENFELATASEAVGTPKKPGPLFPLRGNEHVRDAFGVGLAIVLFKQEYGAKDSIERFRLFTV